MVIVHGGDRLQCKYKNHYKVCLLFSISYTNLKSIKKTKSLWKDLQLQKANSLWCVFSRLTDSRLARLENSHYMFCEWHEPHKVSIYELYWVIFGS